MRDRDLMIDDAYQNTRRWSGIPYAALDLGATARRRLLMSSTATTTLASTVSCG
jgi:hypothetical protein